MQKSIKEYFREIWGYGLSHKEKMQLPIHRFISKMMIPCYLSQKLFYALASLCRDRRLDSEIKKLFRKNDKKVASYQCALKVAKKQKNKAKILQVEKV